MVTPPYKNHYNTEQQNTILDIMERIGDKKSADGVDLLLLFDYWKIAFPKVKMDVNCGSCRLAVVKFFKQIKKEING